MSTVFCTKSSSYLIHSKHVSFEKCLRELSNQSLTGPRVSEAGRPYLYTSRTHSQIFKHVGSRLDAPEPKDWYIYSLERFPYQPQGDRLDRRTR